MLLDFHPAALAELEAAVTWVEREIQGHGALLYNEVRRRVTQAARLPKSGAPIRGFEARFDVRSYVLRRFEYRVITAVIASEAPIVVAIAHMKREPSYWRKRLERIAP